MHKHMCGFPPSQKNQKSIWKMNNLRQYQIQIYFVPRTFSVKVLRLQKMEIQWEEKFFFFFRNLKSFGAWNR